MNIDYKKAILESQQRLAQLAEIDGRLDKLPEHLRALLPHLDAVEKVGTEIHALNDITRQYIPNEIVMSLAYIRRDIETLRATLIRNGNPLIAAIEPINN